tara:strand:+ start:118 stop:1053 length:936 start_codon:yes stop_codon:yes gene_type:complete
MNNLALTNQELVKPISVLFKDRVYPIHVKFNPATVCNIRCTFCNNDDYNYLSPDAKNLANIPDTIKMFKGLRDRGTKAVSIEGGGEPTVHPDFNLLVSSLAGLGLEVGLLTNGTRLKSIEPVMGLFTWVRVSFSDEYEDITANDLTLDLVLDQVSSWIKTEQQVDISFNFVDMGIDNVIWDGVVEFIAEHQGYSNFLGMRVSPDDTQDKGLTKESDLESVIFTGGVTEDTPIPKGGRCKVGLARPVITPNHTVYACCRLMEGFNFSAPYKEDILTIIDKQIEYTCSLTECPFNSLRETLNSIDEVRHPNFV